MLQMTLLTCMDPRPWAVNNFLDVNLWLQQASAVVYNKGGNKTYHEYMYREISACTKPLRDVEKATKTSLL